MGWKVWAPQGWMEVKAARWGVWPRSQPALLTSFFFFPLLLCDRYPSLRLNQRPVEAFADCYLNATKLWKPRPDWQPAEAKITPERRRTWRSAQNERQMQNWWGEVVTRAYTWVICIKRFDPIQIWAAVEKKKEEEHLYGAHQLLSIGIKILCNMHKQMLE